VGVIVGLIILGACAYYANRAIQDARSRSWAGPRTQGMRTRAKTPRVPSGGGIRPVRHEIRLARAQAAITDWLEQQRHHRANGTAPAATARRPALVRRLRPQAASSPPPPAQPAPPSRQPAPPPSSPPSPPPAPAASNGRTPPVAGTSTGAEQLIEGVNRIHSEAAAGGIHHKQAALKAASEGSIRFSAMAQMLARTMSEPGNNYGPEITEPLGQAAQHLQAAAMAFGEADTNLTSLIHMSVGDLAKSSRQAPHHSELSENGSR
jgi:hypothetical protein